MDRRRAVGFGHYEAMPVRIYEIAKDLNLDSKTVLTKARELGIPAAKVASSSLDKITAEYLREQLLPMAQPASGSEPAAVAPPPEPVVPSEPERPTFIAPELPHVPEAEPPELTPEAAIETDEGAVEAPDLPLTATEAPANVEGIEIQEAPLQTEAPGVEQPSNGSAPAPAPAAVPVPPPAPPKTQIGQLVGRIDLGQIRPRPGATARDDRGGPPLGRSGPEWATGLPAPRAAPAPGSRFRAAEVPAWAGARAAWDPGAATLGACPGLRPPRPPSPRHQSLSPRRTAP